MNIQSINFINNKEKNNNLYFKAIKLNANQLKESKKLLEDFVACPDSQLERMKLKVFKFFEKDLLNELELKYKKYYIKEDCLQDLFLSFFELLNDLKQQKIKIRDFIPSINKIELDSKNKKSDVVNYSLEEVLGPRQIKNSITEDDLEPYQEVLTETEIEKLSDEIEKFINNENVDKLIQEVIKGRKKGLTFDAIGKELKIAPTTAIIKFNYGINKIKESQGILPKEYDILSDFVVNEYNLKITKEEFKEKLVNFQRFKIQSVESLKYNISEISKILGIEEKQYVKSFTRNIELISMDPKTILNKRDQLVKFCGITENDFAKLVLSDASILHFDMLNLSENIKRNAKILNVPIRKIMQIGTNATFILYLNSDMLNKKIKQHSTILKMKPSDYISKIVSYPDILYNSSAALKSKIKQLSEIFKLTEDKIRDFSKQDFYLLKASPKVIKNNILKASSLLNVPYEYYINYLTKNITNLKLSYSYKPETILEKYELRKFYEYAHKRSNMPFEIIHETKDDVFKSVLTYLIKKQQKILTIGKNNIEDYIKKYPEKIYRFELPEHKYNEEFIKYVEDICIRNIGKVNIKFKIIPNLWT